MRVLHVINQFCDSAGAEVSLRHFLTSAAGGEIQNGVAVLTDTRNDFRQIEGLPVELFVPNRPQPGRLHAFRHVSQAIDTFQPQIVHTALFEADLIGRLAARRHSVPAVSTLVNMPWVAQSGSPALVQRLKFAGVRAVDRYLARRATYRFHAVARVVADATSDAFGVPADRFAVVHRGRSTHDLGRRTDQRREEVRGSLERHLGRSFDGPVLLAVGREEPAKNHAFLLGLLDDLRALHPGLVLLIAGRRGTASEALDQIVHERNLEDVVVRLGLRRDIPDLLAAADVFVFPSHYEGAAGAVIEAMALEVPIVASDAPALVELLDDGRCGVIAPIGDQERFTEAISQVLIGSPGVDVRAKAARERFEREYEAEAVGRAMLELYESVLGSDS